MTRVVALGVFVVVLLAGCLGLLQREFGGDKVLRGYGDHGEAFGRVDPGVPHFPGWTGRLYVGTDDLNGPTRGAAPCHPAILVVESRAQPEFYERISAHADQQGGVRGIYLEFRAVTMWKASQEGMRLVALLVVEPAPAGDAWRALNCAATPDFYAHGD